MENVKEYGYIQFPLCLLQETFMDINNGLNMILSYGIINYAGKLPYETASVAKQVCYSWYRNRDILQSSITRKIYKAIDEETFTEDVDYNGFAGDTFYPDENIDELSRLFSSNPSFKKDCILQYQINLASSQNHLSLILGPYDATIREYNQALFIKQKFEAKYGPDVMPTIKAKVLIDFRDKYQSQIDLFRGIISIKSLIGFKKYIATTRNVILMRMTGCKSLSAMDSLLSKNKKAKEFHEKYFRSDKALRYNFDKLFYELLTRGFIRSKIFERSVSRKIFISTKLSYEELADEIIKFAKKRSHDKEENEARERIRATI